MCKACKQSPSSSKLKNRSLLNCAPARLRALPITDTRLTRLRTFTLTNKRPKRIFFVLRCVVLIVKYDSRLKNPRKGTGLDFIHLKLIKFSSNVIYSHLYSIIIKDLEKNKYSEEPKRALVRPIFKKNERSKIGKYRPVSILNGVSKIYERCIHNSLFSYAETILPNLISAYKKPYSSNHVLLRLIEHWKKSRDNKNFVGTVLLDLSKAFDCIPHDLLAAKHHAYGLSEDAVTFVHSYLKRRKQGVKINDTESEYFY